MGGVGEGNNGYGDVCSSVSEAGLLSTVPENKMIFSFKYFQNISIKYE